MLYLDTSLIVAAATIERESDRVDQWLDQRREEKFATSTWTITEFSAALSIKLRVGGLTLVKRDEALTYFDLHFIAAFYQADVIAEDFTVAARLADRFALGVRGGDALHLAIAARLDATLCTLDKRQAEAGRALGINTSLI